MTFSKWLDTFNAEKNIDLDTVLEVEGQSGPNFIPVQILVDAIKAAPASEQKGIKHMIVRLDFLNKDVVGYYRHLAQAIAI
jgi:hypothetical protein